MLEGEQFLYAGNDWKTDNKTSSHHIAHRLSRRNKILYVEAAGQRAPRASRRDISKAVRRVFKAFQKPRRISDSLHVCSPLILPFHRFAFVRRFNEKLLGWTLKLACRRVGLTDPIVWMTIPHYASIMRSPGGRGVVYYCTDEYSSMPLIDVDAVLGMEREILTRADVVFVISEDLYESKSKLNGNVYYSPHGVDVDHFHKAMERSTVLPGDIKDIPKPIAGFFGLIEEWVDLEVIAYLAKKLPDVSFVLIGRVARDVSVLRGLGNVHLLGQKPYESIPAYLKAFDVGLIPFKRTEVVKNSSPLKFMEYLAGGRPVVTTRIKALERYEHLAYFADSDEEFLDGVRRSLEENAAETAGPRIEAMKGESWDSRFDKVCATVRTHIPAR